MCKDQFTFLRTGPRETGIYKAHSLSWGRFCRITDRELAVPKTEMATRNVTQIAFCRGSMEFDLDITRPYTAAQISRMFNVSL